MDMSINGPRQMGNLIIEEVWYEGTDAVKKGEALCYNTDKGTATDFDGQRCNWVERSSSSNHMAFAGVTERSYSAQNAGQRLRIAVPGSKGVPIALAVDTVIDTGLLSFQVGGGTGAGRFYTGKYKGRGSAIPRQTVTALLEGGMTGGTMSVAATDGVTVTVADSSDFTAGDTLVILAGELDGTGIFTLGKHTISSITNGTTIVLTAPCLSTLSTGSLTLTGYIYTGNPTCQADLLTGDESGGIEFLTPLNAGQTGVTHMVGGVSYIPGVGTLAADCDVTFAQGSLPGDTKAFVVLGTVGTSDVVIDLATNGIKRDGSTGMQEIDDLDTAGDAVYLIFDGVVWHTVGFTGCTETSS